MTPYSLYLFVLYSFLEHNGSGVLPSLSVPVVWSFLLLISILLHARTTIYLPSHHLIDIWVVSSLGLLWIKLLWTSLYNLCVNICFFFLGKGLCTELLSHMANVCLTLLEFADLFSKMFVAFYICSTFLSQLGIVSLIGLWWFAIVGFVCISTMADDVHLFM